MRAPLLPAALLSCALLLGLLAAAIWLISEAHGHGLASNDRRAILGLTLAAAASLVTGAVVVFRR